MCDFYLLILTYLLSMSSFLVLLHKYIYYKLNIRKKVYKLTSNYLTCENKFTTLVVRPNCCWSNPIGIVYHRLHWRHYVEIKETIITLSFDLSNVITVQIAGIKYLNTYVIEENTWEDWDGQERKQQHAEERKLVNDIANLHYSHYNNVFLNCIFITIALHGSILLLE